MPTFVPRSRSAFEPLKSILVFAPPADKLDAALKAEKLPPDWLGYDGNRRPFGVSAEVTAAMRRDLSAKLAKTFDAQGIAAVTAPVANNRSRLVLSLLGAGIAEPDVIEVNLDQQDTVANAVAQIDRALSFLTPSIGVTAIDVADISRPDRRGGRCERPCRTGRPSGRGHHRHRPTGSPLADAAALAAAVSTHTGARRLALEVKDKAGATKKVDVKVVMRPRLIGISDQTLFVNRTLVTLRARLSEANRLRRAGVDPPQPGRCADAARVVERCATRTAAGDAHRRSRCRYRHRPVPAGPLRCPARATAPMPKRHSRRRRRRRTC